MVPVLARRAVRPSGLADRQGRVGRGLGRGRRPGRPHHSVRGPPVRHRGGRVPRLDPVRLPESRKSAGGQRPRREDRRRGGGVQAAGRRRAVQALLRRRRADARGHRPANRRVRVARRHGAVRLDRRSGARFTTPTRGGHAGGLQTDRMGPWRSLVLSADGTLAAYVVSTGRRPEERRLDRIVLCDAHTGAVARRGAAGRPAGTSDSPSPRTTGCWRPTTGTTSRSGRWRPGTWCGRSAGTRIASRPWRSAAPAAGWRPPAHDSTVLVWELSAPAKGEPADWWNDLASADAATAYAAVWRVGRRPGRRDDPAPAQAPAAGDGRRGGARSAN